MHVGLIIDQERLRREHAMLGRVTAGLADEGLQLTGILPEPGETRDQDEPPLLTVTDEITTRMQVPPWMRRVRARHLANAVGSAAPDLLHAIGDAAWTVALDLGRLIDRPVTLDLWSAEQLRRVPPGRAATRVAGYLAPTEPLAEAVGRRTEPDLVQVVPMGVPVPERQRRVLKDPDSSMTLGIIASGNETAGPREMLTGLARLVRELPQIQACLELRGPHEHDIWRHARRLDLLGHVSTIVDAALHRPLLTGCDVLIVPERLGQVRSIVFEAMAMGVPVVAADDPYLGFDREAVCLVQGGTADEWTDRLRQVLTDSDVAARLGRDGRASVARGHSPQAQVASLFGAFDQVTSGGAHTFRG